MKDQKTSGYAQVNGLNMYYQIYGEGNLPLVLIHGGGSTIQSNFEPTLPYLADYGKIIAVELQAHGRTSDRDTPESFENDAADVIGLLKYLKVEKANFIGYSDGGCTALEIAINYPQFVNKGIIISANYLREGMVPGFFEGLGAAGFDDMPRVLKDAFRKVNNNEDQLLSMFKKDQAKRYGFKDRDEQELKNIKAPLFFISSDKDVILPQHTMQMASLVPNSQFAIMPGEHGAFLGDVYSFKQGSNLPQAAAIIFKEFLR